jgi:hypothetical protein
MTCRRAYLMVVPPAFTRPEANVAEIPTSTITEQERKTLDEHQFALATTVEVVKNGVANYNACLAELQEVASPIAARLRADCEASSPASVKPGALIAELDAIASMKALNVTLIGLTEDLPPPVREDLPPPDAMTPSKPTLKRSGLMCPQCRQPVAKVEHTSSGLQFECPACGHRWSWSQPKSN